MKDDQQRIDGNIIQVWLASMPCTVELNDDQQRIDGNIIQVWLASMPYTVELNDEAILAEGYALIEERNVYLQFSRASAHTAV